MCTVFHILWTDRYIVASIYQNLQSDIGAPAHIICHLCTIHYQNKMYIVVNGVNIQTLIKSMSKYLHVLSCILYDNENSKLSLIRVLHVFWSIHYFRQSIEMNNLHDQEGARTLRIYNLHIVLFCVQWLTAGSYCYQYRYPERKKV